MNPAAYYGCRSCVTFCVSSSVASGCLGCLKGRFRSGNAGQTRIPVMWTSPVCGPRQHTAEWGLPQNTATGSNSEPTDGRAGRKRSRSLGRSGQDSPPPARNRLCRWTMSIRNPKREELRRLESKTLDAQFKTAIQQGLNCSPFEAAVRFAAEWPLLPLWLPRGGALQHSLFVRKRDCPRRPVGAGFAILLTAVV